jgi:steroid 5-alpha reductase family enzyme
MEHFRTPSVGWVVSPTPIERRGALWLGNQTLYARHPDFFCDLVGWLIESELQTLSVSSLVPGSSDDEEVMERFADLVCSDYYLNKLYERYGPSEVESLFYHYNEAHQLFAEFVIWLAPRVAGIIEDYLTSWTINTQIRLTKLTPYGVSVSITLYA